LHCVTSLSTRRFYSTGGDYLRWYQVGPRGLVFPQFPSGPIIMRIIIQLWKARITKRLREKQAEEENVKWGKRNAFDVNEGDANELRGKRTKEGGCDVIFRHEVEENSKVKHGHGDLRRQEPEADSESEQVALRWRPSSAVFQMSAVVVSLLSPLLYLSTVKELTLSTMNRTNRLPASWRGRATMSTSTFLPSQFLGISLSSLTHLVFHNYIDLSCFLSSSLHLYV